jgi:hypothetical protein
VFQFVKARLSRPNAVSARFNLSEVGSRQSPRPARARRTSEKPQIARHDYIARNTEVLPLQDCVENADDVPLRVYDTERPLLYFSGTGYAERDHVGRRVSFLTDLLAGLVEGWRAHECS